MSTVAWDGVSLSADSQVTDGSLIFSDSKAKIRKNIGIFAAVAGCGPLDELQRVFSKVPAATTGIHSRVFHRTVTPELDVVVLTKEGELYDYRCDSKNKVTVCRVNYPCAWGSGSSFAIAAMDFGKNSKDAVKYASTKDLYTNSKVTTVKARKRC